MSEIPDPTRHNPMQHPEEQPVELERPLRLGRLVVILACAVTLVALLAVSAAKYYS